MGANVEELGELLKPLDGPLRLATKSDRLLLALKGMGRIGDSIARNSRKVSLDPEQHEVIKALVELTRSFDSTQELGRRREILEQLGLGLQELGVQVREGGENVVALGSSGATRAATKAEGVKRGPGSRVGLGATGASGSTGVSGSTRNSGATRSSGSRVNSGLAQSSRSTRSSSSPENPSSAGASKTTPKTTPRATQEVTQDTDSPTRKPRSVTAEGALAPVQVEGDALSQSLLTLPRIGPAAAQRLAAKGLHTFADVLVNLPRAYQDRREPTEIARAQPGQHVLIQARVADFRERFARRRMWELDVEDHSGRLTARWFGYRPGAFRSFIPGTPVVLSGEVRQGYRQRLELVHPDVELGETVDDPASFGRIVPVYSEIEGVSARHYRRVAQLVTEACAQSVQDYWPQSFRDKHELPPLGEALAAVHFPPNDADPKELERFSSPAQRRLVFDELFFVQLGLALKRRGVELERGITMKAGPKIIEKALARLPFTLTGAQSRALAGIAQDLERGTPMNRLLQGDVGSGKTAVALGLALISAQNGYQSAIMAPTEILAEQHYQGFRKLLGGDLLNHKPGQEPIGVTLLTAGLGARARRFALNEAASGTAQIVVGTHALLSEGVEFRRLGAVVIDEQHRFGVVQRARLMEKGSRPHVLVMTATPIPRTLALTLYGDLNLSVIDELPPGRTPVSTKYYSARYRPKAYDLLRKELRNGRQAYIVLPLVEESDKMDLRAATSEAQRLAKEELAGFSIGLVHGRMSTDERNAAMESFRKGETQVLVATTVIEVGVDVPNASVMMIEHAERFGLSQLHQLRGRVGRGAAKSWCLLMSEGGKLSVQARERLKVMEKHADGFRIAEEDLKIRGPGEFLGTRQSGAPDLVVADLLRDARVLEEVRDAAFMMVEDDPDLQDPAHRAVAQELKRRWEGKTSFARIG